MSRDEMIEVMALAIGDAGADICPDDAIAEAALAALEAQGLVVVPKEPNEAMLQAARVAPIPAVMVDSMKEMANISLRTSWRAMIAAANPASSG